MAADIATGGELWSVDRDYGPSVSPAIAETSKRRILIYTEGFGDNPPEGTATPSPDGDAESVVSPSSGSGSDAGPFDSHVAAIDLDTQEPVWDAPVQLDAVSRTGVTVDGDTAYLGDNTGTVYAIDVATGAIRWTADAGGFLDDGRSPCPTGPSSRPSRETGRRVRTSSRSMRPTAPRAGTTR